MQLNRIEENPILKLSVAFALEVVAYCEQLEQEKRYIISRQFLKSGTSIGANAFEAQNAESKADFIHKMKIAAKEADEPAYWLLLCSQANRYPTCLHLIEKIEEISKLLNKILFTARKSAIVS
jgi:four helix bundle protein